MSVTLKPVTGTFLIDHLLRRPRFGDGDQGGEGGQDGNQPPGSGGQQNGGQGGGQHNDPEFNINDPKTYSETHVKKIHSENANYRHRVKELEDQLNARGDYDEIKKRVTDYERKELADQKKFQDLADSEKKRADEEAQKRAQIENARKEDRARVRVERSARRLGLLDSAADDLDLLDISGLFKDGDPSDEAIVAFVEDAKKKRPHWFAQEGGQQGGEGGQGGKRAAQGTPSGHSGGSGKPEDAKDWDDKRLNNEWNTIRL